MLAVLRPSRFAFVSLLMIFAALTAQTARAAGPKGIVLKNVHIQAAKGMNINDAEVTGADVTIKVDSGKPMEILPSAKVTIK
jgi:hypothetical protein